MSNDDRWRRPWLKVRGVLDFYGTGHAKLFPGKTLTKSDFTYQVSDHLPLWLLVNTDDDAFKLDQIINPKG